VKRVKTVEHIERECKGLMAYLGTTALLGYWTSEHDTPQNAAGG